MKSGASRKRFRRGPIIALLFFIFFVGWVLLFSNDNASSLPNTRKPRRRLASSDKPESGEINTELNDAQCGYTFDCAPATYTERDKEVSRLLNYNIHNDITNASINQYNPANLSDVPVIEGGLYTDQQDLELPRLGESYVTFAEYLDCLAARLGVDYKNQKEMELSVDDMEESFPYAMSMATFELGDIKTLMCNINVPIQRMRYIINSDITPVTNFFRDVEKAFKFTKRLRIIWPGYNMGFAGSVNFALREAMRYTYEEVPFMFTLNNDIRFPEQTLPFSLRGFRKTLLPFKEFLEGLQAEVAAEPSEYTPKNRRHPLLRSSDNSTLLVTSPSLPDRLRYMNITKRRNMLKDYYGLLYFDNKGDTSAFGISRLGMEMVGFLDENYYPAYYEDTDWRYRMLRIGLSDYYVKGVQNKKHFFNAVLKLGRRYILRPSTASESERLAGYITNILRPVPSSRLMFMKYGYNHPLAIGPYADCNELPADAWVMDVPRRLAIMKALQLARTFFNSNITHEEAVHATARTLNWLPEEQRKQIMREVAGRPMNEVIEGAFKDCKLIRHQAE